MQVNEKWSLSFHDFMTQIYAGPLTDEQQVFESESYLNLHSPCRSITIQLTEACNCACSYCYQINKSSEMMSIETGKAIIDYLFNEYKTHPEEGFINQKDTKAIILDFIGGEPFLNVDTADAMCEYFWTRCILEHHPWEYTWMAAFSTNGSLYKSKKVQTFIKKYTGHLSIGITVDGPKEIHDRCRIYKDSKKGNFDDAFAALKEQQQNTNLRTSTKVTIAPENLAEINTIIRFFIENGIYDIHANPVFEADWTIEHARIYYAELKQMADYILNSTDQNFLALSLFTSNDFGPLNPTGSDNKNWCGGTGSMLAFDPNGIAYPCLRYMKSSLGTDREPIILGNCKDGVFQTEESKKIKTFLDSITRESQSTIECFNCSIASGCSWCSAWNYQLNGTPNKRCTRICNMHKAESLANAYFWNKYFVKYNIGKVFHRFLSDTNSLEIINSDELDLLNNLEKEAAKTAKEISNDKKNYNTRTCEY